MKRTDNRFFACIATVTVMILAVFCYFPAQAANGGLLMPGAPKPLPEIPYLDEKGAEHTLAGLAGKTVVLHFWATWCAPCVEELPHLQKAAAGFGENVVILPLAVERDAAKVQAFYDAHQITLPVLTVSMKTMRALDVKGLPATILVNGNGEEAARHAGIVDWESEAVLGLVKEKTAP